MALDAFRIPPVPAPAFLSTAASVVAEANVRFEETKRLHSEIFQRHPSSEWRFDNVMLPLIHQYNQNMLTMWRTQYNSEFTTDKELREKSDDIYENWEDKIEVEGFDAQFCEAIQVVVDADEEGLDSESRKWLEVEHLACFQGGKYLKGDTKQKFDDLGTEATTLKKAFLADIKPESEIEWFTREELEGVPLASLNRFRQGEGENEGKLGVTFRQLDYLQVMEFAERSETRQRMIIRRDNLYPENVPRLASLTKVRAERVDLLGYGSWAEYRLSNKMMQTPKRVNDFLKDLVRALVPTAKRTVQRLKGLKRELTRRRGEEPLRLGGGGGGGGGGEGGDTTDNHYFLWDNWILQRLLLEEEYKVDERETSAYFSANATEDAMLRIFEGVFGLSFEEITGENLDKVSSTGNGPDVLYHHDDSLRLFAVWNDDRGSTDFLGYLYFDIYAHKGKVVDSIFTKPMLPTFTRPDGTHAYPVISLHSNLALPTADRPTLLHMNYVVNLFHELGHCIHHFVHQLKYATMSGTKGVQDFLELPSVMLENFVYNPEVLQAISRHWSYIKPEYRQAFLKESGGEESTEQPPERLPIHLAENLVKSRFGNFALEHLRIAFFSLFDQRIHTFPAATLASFDFTAYWNRLRPAVAQTQGMEVYNSDFHWGHAYSGMTFPANAYNAVYYQYNLCRAWAMDIYETMFARDPLNPAVGRRWRHVVLERAGVVPPVQTLVDFMGREPNVDALKRAVERAEEEQHARLQEQNPAEEEEEQGDIERTIPAKRPRLSPGRADNDDDDDDDDEAGAKDAQE